MNLYFSLANVHKKVLLLIIKNKLDIIFMIWFACA